MSKFRIGKLFRMAGLGYETLILDDMSADEKEVTLFANSIRGTFLAEALGRLIDPEWYEQNKRDMEELGKLGMTFDRRKNYS